MSEKDLRLSRFHRVGAAVHAVALSGDGEHLLVGSELGLQLMDRRGNVKHRREGGAFNAVALSPRLETGLGMERAGRLYRLDFETVPVEKPGERMRVVAVDIWEQRDDLYSLDYAPCGSAPHGGEKEAGLIALGHHAQGLTALDGRGQLLWRLGPREGFGAAFYAEKVTAGDGPGPDGINGPDARKWPRRGTVVREAGNHLGGRTWHAAISTDCRTIYAASLGRAAHTGDGEIVGIDAAVGKPTAAVTVSGRVAMLTSLPPPLGVAAVVQRENRAGRSCHLRAFDDQLRREAWGLTCAPGVMITAVASSPAAAALFVGTNSGELLRIGAFTGRILARYDLLYASAVLSVAVAETGEIAAGLANGQVAYLERVKDEG